MAKRHADPETLDHIIELRNKLAEAERQRDNALDRCMALEKLVWELRVKLNLWPMFSAEEKE